MKEKPITFGGTMGKEILLLNEIRRDDVAVAGGKGANLGELVHEGFPVPPGFIVSAGTCETFFKAIELDQTCKMLQDASPDKMASHCRSIQQTIENTEFPSDLVDSIMATHKTLFGDREAAMVCAVRSSATAEDLGDASFAGQHATYYYVTRNHLLKMIKSCWASLWNMEAVSYRDTHGIDHSQVFMAVVVQEMILSDISGVTFTANPVTGSRDEIVTESSWGMGAAIVDGRVTPDHYVIERKDLRLKEKRIAEKRFMVPPRLDNETKTRLQEVPHGLRQKETLTPELIRTISEWSIKAEEHFGNPQDVEWAVSEGNFFMLQSRPITVMGKEEIGKDVDGQYVIFKPLLENFTDPLTPITQDVIGLLFAPPLIRLVSGWTYLSVKHIKRILPFKLSDQDVAAASYDMNILEPMKVSLLKLPFFFCMVFFSYLAVGVLFARTRRLPDDFMGAYRKLCRKVDNNPDLGPFETLKRLFSWSRFFEPVGHYAIFVNLTSMRYIFGMDILRALLRRWAPDVREDAEALLCSGTDGILSADMGRGIWALAKEARGQPSVRQLLETHRPENVLAKLRGEREAKTFLKHLDHFLSINGHRALKELELQSSRWEEDPAPVLGMIRNYLLIESDPIEHEKKTSRARKELESTIRKTLRKYPLEKLLGMRWGLIRYVANRTKFFTKMRENSRFYHIMGFYSIRKKILRIETELMSQGRLRCRGDIFFLGLKEIEKMQAGELDWQNVEDRIRDRRMAHIRLSKMLPPKTLGIAMEESSSGTPVEMATAMVYQGQSASPGSYEGVAHVILDPSIDIELKPGEILVAPYTDPAWTPLFLTAGAAVVEIGSYLSHAGTVAREFGMPCVVDLADCTKRIHTGARVQVDGDQGIVRLINDDDISAASG